MKNLILSLATISGLMSSNFAHATYYECVGSSKKNPTYYQTAKVNFQLESNSSQIPSISFSLTTIQDKKIAWHRDFYSEGPTSIDTSYSMPTYKGFSRYHLIESGGLLPTTYFFIPLKLPSTGSFKATLQQVGHIDSQKINLICSKQKYQ